MTIHHVFGKILNNMEPWEKVPDKTVVEITPEVSLPADVMKAEIFLPGGKTDLILV